MKKGLFGLVVTVALGTAGLIFGSGAFLDPQSITLRDTLVAGAIDQTGQFAYLGIDQSVFGPSGAIYKVKLRDENGVLLGAPLIDSTATFLDRQPRVLKVSKDGSTLYVLSNSDQLGWRFQKISTTNEFSIIDTMRPSDYQITSLAVDAQERFAYLGTDSGMLVQVDLSTMIIVNAVQLYDQGISAITTGVIDSSGTFGYFGAGFNQSGRLIKVRLRDEQGYDQSPNVAAIVDLDPDVQNDRDDPYHLRAAVIDPSNEFLYLTAYQANPGEGSVAQVIKIRVGSNGVPVDTPFRVDFKTIGNLGEELFTGAIATDGKYAYFGGSNIVAKVALGDQFENTTPVISEDVANYGQYTQATLVDPKNNLVYFGLQGGAFLRYFTGESESSPQPLNYTVTYDGNGGDALTVPTAQIKTHDLPLTISSTQPTRAGHTFLGWNTARDGSADAYLTGNNYALNADLTLYAQWAITTYSVSFQTNGGDTVSTVVATQNASIKLPSPTRTGYALNRWNSAPTFDGVGYAADSTYEVVGNTVLYAEWSTNNYLIEFDTDGGSAMGWVTYNYLAEIARPETPTKNGYRFTGWDVDVPERMPANDLKLTAKWTINTYRLAINANGGSGGYTVTADYGAAIQSPNDPTRNGYTFAGWDADVPTVMPAQDVTVNAQWTVNQYRIAFNTNGGSPVSAITTDFGHDVQAPDAPTRDGYTFAGWDVTIPTVMPAQDVTVNAQWTVNQYRIVFNPNGGSVGSTITANYGEAVQLPNNPTRNGYTFAGWDADVPTVMPAQDVTVNAQWTVNQYRITFDSNGGTTIQDSITRDFDTEIGDLLPQPTRMGHLFEGWRYNDAALPEKMPAMDIVASANWVAKNYSTVGIPTDMDPFEVVQTDSTTIQTGQTFGIPTHAKLTTTTFFTEGAVTNNGTLEADALTVMGLFYNGGNLVTKQTIQLLGGAAFRASANSDIWFHHTPAETPMIGSLFRPMSLGVQGFVPGVFVADGSLNVVLDGAVLDQPKYTFQVIQGEIEGEFDTVNLDPLPNGYFWDRSELYTLGVLHIIGTATGMTGRPLNYPNPFRMNTGTYIGYSLNGANDTELRVYTIYGQEVIRKTFVANVDEGAKAGYNKVVINAATTGSQWSAGVYPYLILQAGKVIGKGRMVVIP